MLKLGAARSIDVIVGMYSSISGLQALGKKLEGTSHNIANANTDEFKKTKVTLLEGKPLGVSVHTEQINIPGPQVLEQTNNGQELIEKSNVELSEEIPNLMLTRRFYQANLKTIKTTDEMLGSLLDVKG